MGCDMGLRIGQVAERVKVNPKTIRYYEEVGLMPRARRSESGHRLYPGEPCSCLQNPDGENSERNLAAYSGARDSGD